MTSLVCIALAVYFEARSEPVAHQMKVASVVLNRVEDDRYPDDACAVVWEPGQFSWTHDGKSDTPEDPVAWSIACAVASEAVELEHRFEATHYLRHDVHRSWEDAFAYLGRFGSHDWYRNDTPYR